MKVAIVHDYLSQMGGAERVVLELSRLFPDAPILTSFYDPQHTYPEFAHRTVLTSSLQDSVDPAAFRQSVLRFPGAFASMDLDAYDVVIVSTSAFAHFVRHPRALVYCYTPPRFLYCPEAYFRSRGMAAAAKVSLSWLRRRDRTAARHHLIYIAISQLVAGRVLRAYDRHAAVVYPPLVTDHLPAAVAPMPDRPRALVISRLLAYKRVDVAIRACALARVPLTVVGSGPEESSLRALGGDVQFLGSVPDRQLPEIFGAHSLLLAPGVEDFGLGPVEANYAGRPVVAVDAGGARETVREGVTGVLVDGMDPAKWAAAIEHVVGRRWDDGELRGSTAPFGRDVFTAAIERGVDMLGSLRSSVELSYR